MFKENFPVHDKRGYVGFVDPSWMLKAPANAGGIPVIGGLEEKIHLEYEGDTYTASRYRWLVQVK
ncbi:MAG: hypothetical protein A3J54_00965 [Candidatus Ryanbacteria bacterium RIFCSPHIGHO2_02_FULL_45_13b]|uniref:Uncharacterized protein n=1 Tax=Candidatus Ryanbacteria bacterium RIFCSPHIGHO2_02_FULL_45_13b TaxID=1802117 RepID=A0A1G2G8K3_9BACT|nr:MAG: hypothetical protein A3J54_00965 [Candidatus Ryanbacteria bacterium RIFCSPHIGHO2_02_FULL_45_13b]